MLSVAEGLHEDDSATSEDGYNIATILVRELQALIYFREGDTEAALETWGILDGNWKADIEKLRQMDYVWLSTGETT